LKRRGRGRELTVDDAVMAGWPRHAGANPRLCQIQSHGAHDHDGPLIRANKKVAVLVAQGLTTARSASAWCHERAAAAHVENILNGSGSISHAR